MVFHVGIDPFMGRAIIYDSGNRKSTTIRVNSVKENEIQKVNEMFNEINGKISGPLGYACVCLFLDYGNQIREEFINRGKSLGFKNIIIIDWLTASYLIVISQATAYKPKNGEIIWIMNENFYYIWQISNKKAKHVSFHSFDTNQTFEEIKNTAVLKKDPNVVLYHNKMNNKNLIEKMPKTCKLFPYDLQTLESGALVKAIIAAGEAPIMQYDVCNILGQDISIMIDKSEIFNLKLHEILPIIKQFPIKRLPEQKVLQVFRNNKIDETINFPPDCGDEFMLDIRVDANGIYSTKLIRLNLPDLKNQPMKFSYFGGVDLSRGEISVLNTATKQRITMSLTLNLSVSNMSQKIELVLKDINKQINYDKNCAIVFHVDDDCFNSVLFEYIAICQIHDFQYISFISTQTAEFINIINEHTLDESIKTIAFISDRIEKRKLYCQKWKNNNGIFKAEGSYFREGGPGDDEANLTKLFHDSNEFHGIDKIFFDSFIDKNVFDKISNKKLNLTAIEYRPSYSAAALTYAEMNFNKTKNFTVENCLNRRFSFIVDEKIVFNVQMGLSLPFKKDIQFKETTIKSFKICERNASGRKNEIEYNFSMDTPKNYKFGLICNINGIITISVEAENTKPLSKMSSHERTSISEKEMKLMLLSKSLENDANLMLDSEKVNYTIPDKFLATNECLDAVGIDLGTTRCCAAVNRKKGIETVYLENTGQRLLPSYVSYDEEYEKCGQVVVDRLRYHANSTVFDVKRIIGKSFEDIIIDPSWPFKVLKVESLGIQRSWRSKILEQNDVFIQVEGNHGKISKTPEEVSAALLKYLKQKTEEFQGMRLEEAVITVPAAFTKSQKIATYVAALLAGWKTIHLLPEPVAATFAYFIDRKLPKNSNILLFDLGGGTLDVCLFKINKEKQLQIICRNGDQNMGGRDFDKLLIDHFTDILDKKFGIEILEKNHYKLMMECQEIKHSLSVTEKSLLEIELFDPTNENVIEITRQEFEKLAEKLLKKIANKIENVLRECKTTNIDKVLYVGGGCRMPMIKQLLQKAFPESEHCCEQHPDEVVAIGAAYYACYLKTDSSKNENRCSLM